MGQPIPFDLDAATVPRTIDYMDVPNSDGTTVLVYGTDFLPTDVVTQMYLVAKKNLNTPDTDPEAVALTITTTPSAAGVLAQLADGSTWLGTFQFTQRQASLLASAYSVEATITRGGTTYKRVIQSGSIQAQEDAIAVGAFWDGTFLFDGSIPHFDGFGP